MKTKFFEEFEKVTDNAFPMLKLNGAVYDKAARKLSVRFIISAFDAGSFSEEKKSEVFSAVQRIFPGIEVEVQYIRTYADDILVKSRVLEFLKSNHPIVAGNIGDDNISVSIENSDLIISLTLDTPVFELFRAGNTEELLVDYLDSIFNYNIYFSCVENVVKYVAGENAIASISSVESFDSTKRLIKVETKNRVMTKGKIGGISQKANYISDLKSECEEIILCGKVSNVLSKTYKNKKYNPDEPKFGPAELPLIRFTIDDSTGKIEVVCFPRVAETEEIVEMLSGKRTIRSDDSKRESEEQAFKEAHPSRFASMFSESGEKEQAGESQSGQTAAASGGVSVICSGKVSKYSNSLSMTANAIFLCDIDYSSILPAVSKPAPEKYQCVFPETFVLPQQQNIFDAGNNVPNFLKGKTFVVFDLETTGLQTESCEIIQLAALKVVDGEEKEFFKTYVKPTSSIPDEVQKLTGITDDMVARAPRIEEVIPDFFKFTRGAVLAGHNILGFDIPILTRIASGFGYLFENEQFDTLINAKQYIPGLRDYRLSTLSAHFSIEHINAHSADSDVLANYGVLKEIAKRM